jgi:hypothetical protein
MSTSKEIEVHKSYNPFISFNFIPHYFNHLKIYFMSVGSKHIATFLLGAAAALAAHKYMTMTPEEKDKLASDIKDKAHQFKDEAENAAGKAKDYFNELKTKGADALKEHLGDAENILHNLFGGKTSATDSTKSV